MSDCRPDARLAHRHDAPNRGRAHRPGRPREADSVSVGMDHGLRYARAVRERAEAMGKMEAIERDIPLRGLRDAASQMAVPLVTRGRLVGVLAVESMDPLAFLPTENTLLSIIGLHLATAIEQLSRDPDETPSDQTIPAPPAGASRSRSTRRFSFFQRDDCVFVDGEYLIRNVPARIFWRLLKHYCDEGRGEFTNRELRMDAWLGLPGTRTTSKHASFCCADG